MKQGLLLLMEYGRFEAWDKKYIWHPFTQMKEWAGEKPVIIESGEGCYLVDTEGRRYLDGVSSLWVNIHGHRKQEIDEAIKAQIDRVSHSTLLGQSNVPAIRLAERLVEVVGRSMCGRGEPVRSPSSGQAQWSVPTRVFYSDNGSTSVEVALKMAFQYWRHKGVEGKNSFVSLNNAYHGDTLGAVSVGGIDIFHAAFGPLLFKTFRSPSPYCYRCELGMESPDCGLACLERLREIRRR
jgi:adenosylmethionine-8-amino-7-oxononanoate aminotransferase